MVSQSPFSKGILLLSCAFVVFRGFCVAESKLFQFFATEYFVDTDEAFIFNKQGQFFGLLSFLFVLASD